MGSHPPAPQLSTVVEKQSADLNNLMNPHRPVASCALVGSWQPRITRTELPVLEGSQN